MAKKQTKKVVQDEIKEEVAEQPIEMSPLPNEEIKEAPEVAPVQEKKAPKQEKKADKKYYAFCRVSGGLIVDIVNSLGEVSKKILVSGNTSELAGDGTRIFNFRPDEFGITELTAEEAKQIKARLEPSKCWKKGFVFIAESEEEGMKLAKEQVAKYPLQGTEQINTSAAKEVEKFSE